MVQFPLLSRTTKAFRAAFVLGFVALVPSCKLDPFPNPDPSDAGAEDAGPDDAGPDDAGPDDAGPDDASTGLSCTLASECESGHCVDGVCCDTECASACHACTAVLKGDGIDGICGIIKPGTELPTECPNGACTADGICSVAPATNLCNKGADCMSGFCVDGVCCAASSCPAIDSCHLGTCASGTCTDIPRVCPGAGMCVDGVCPGQCTGLFGFSGLPVIPYYHTRSGDVWTVVMGDLDGDGFQDLVNSTYGLNGSQYQGSIGVYRNNGNATFSSTGMGATGGIARDVLALADMNNDGTLDIVEAGTGIGSSQSGTVYLNDGQWGFTPLDFGIGFGDGVKKLVIADLDNDGFRDLLVQGVGHLYAKLNDTSANLGPTIDTTTMDYSDVDAADLNADGRADLVFASSTTNSVQIRIGNGDGTFGSPVTYPAVSGVKGVALRDIDADGDSDLVASNGVDTDVRINLGNGAFSAPVTYNGGSVHLADLNGDGRLDILGATSLFNNGDGTFAEQMMAYMPIEKAAFGDLDGDGLADIARVMSGVGIGVLMNPGNGQFTLPYGQYDLSFANTHQIVAADLNGDNLEDLALITSLGTVGVRINMGSGVYAAQVDYPAGVGPIVLAAADMDADGQLDLVASGNANVGVLFNMGGGIFGPVIEYTANPMPKLGSATGDFNGDGYSDVARLEPPAENATLSVMFNQGNGTLGPRVEIAKLTMNPAMIYPDTVFPEELVASDLNADGYSDLVVRGGPNNIEIFMSDGMGGFVLQGQNIWWLVDSFVVADYNGDGYADIATMNAEVESGFGATHSSSTVMLNNGDGTFHYWKSNTYSFISYATISVAADVDGNGFKDLIIHKEALSVYLNDGVTFGPEIRYATGYGAMIATDIDGDGTSELLSAVGALHDTVCLP